MRLLILSTRRGRLENAVLDEARLRGHESSFVYPNQVGLRLETGETVCSLEADVCLIRRTRYQFEAAIAIAQHLHNIGVPLVDPLASLFHPISKAIEMLRCQKSVHLPTTAFLWAGMMVDEVVRTFPLPAFLKPTAGWSGQGTMLVTTREQLKDVLTEWAESRIEENFLLQSAVGGREYRASVVGRRVWLAEKHSPHSVKSERNCTVYRRVRDAAAEEIAVSIAENLGLDIAGVDIIRDDSGAYWVLECNRNPGMPDPETFAPIISSIVDLLEIRCRE